MKALSLWNPWASLIAYGLKKIETRDRLTHHRGPLAIHAAKKWDFDQRDTWLEFRNEFADVACLMPPELPLGCIVAVVELRDCKVMTPPWIDAQTPMERALGGWAVGRYGYTLANVHRVDPPVPFKGGQFIFDVPQDTAPQLLAAYEACTDGIARTQGAAW